MAGVVDWFLAMVVGVAVSIGAAILFALAVSGENSFGTNFGAYLIYFGLPTAFIGVIAWFSLTALWVASKDETIGHRLLGMRILQTDGGRIKRRRALVRQYLGSPLLLGYVTPLFVLIPVAYVLLPLWDLTHPLDSIGAISGGLVFIWIYLGLVVSVVLSAVNHVAMGFDRNRRGWHDRLMGTVVVKDQ